MENPANPCELRIFNQFTQTFSVNELAEKVKTAGKMLDLDVQIKKIENPRKELEEHYYNPKHIGLLDLGLEPNYLTDNELIQMMEHVIKYRDRIKKHKIFRGTKWA